MTNREPPNLREAECCLFCKHYDYRIQECKKFIQNKDCYDTAICDDYERDAAQGLAPQYGHGNNCLCDDCMKGGYP